MKTNWQKFYESKTTAEYFKGWDEAVSVFKNWGSPRPDGKTPIEWAKEFADKLKSLGNLDERNQGTLDALLEFVKKGKVEFRGTSLPGNENGMNKSSPFSSN